MKGSGSWASRNLAASPAIPSRIKVQDIYSQAACPGFIFEFALRTLGRDSACRYWVPSGYSWPDTSSCLKLASISLRRKQSIYSLCFAAVAPVTETQQRGPLGPVRSRSKLKIESLIMPGTRRICHHNCSRGLQRAAAPGVPSECRRWTPPGSEAP